MTDAAAPASAAMTGDGAMSPRHAVLHQFLQAVGWRGEMRTFLESLPHAAETIDFVDARAVLAQLGYLTVERTAKPAALSDAMLPALVARADGDFGVIERRDGVLFFIDADALEGRPLADQNRVVRLWHTAEIGKNDRDRDPARWLRTAAVHLRPLMTKIVGVTLVLNLTAILLPLYVLGAYNLAMSGRSTTALASLMAAILGWLVIDTAIRVRRGAVIAHLGARIDYLVGAETLQRLLGLPLGASAQSSRGDQLAVLRQFERIREIFTGTIAVSILDMPFIVLLIGTLFFVGGPLGWIPVVLLLIFGVIAAVAFPMVAARLARQAAMRQERDSLVLEMLTQQRAIREHGGERKWLERMRANAVAVALEDLRGSRLTSGLQVMSTCLVTMAGILILSFGAVQVIEGAMSAGALMAAMALTWRCLAPIDALFMGLFRVGSIRLCILQLDRLMKLKAERSAERLPRFMRRFSGAIEVRNLSFRYNARAEPALFGVSFDVKPGEVIAVAGPSGSGKSTLLRMLLGLHAPQMGTIRLDGLDIRQIDPWELRALIGFAPQTADLFYGSLAQNLRLAEPNASNAAVAQAIMDADLLEFVAGLKDGVHARMSERAWSIIGSGKRQRVGLARAFVRQPPLLLLDEPGAHLDQIGDEALLRKLQALRGKATVIMTTHRPSHMRAADRVIYLEAGRKRFDGPPQELEAALNPKKAAAAAAAEKPPAADARPAASARKGAA
jgi:ABC-type bacteriocin/lantibiotic exporter with double-glycine peptidase domain